MAKPYSFTSRSTSLSCEQCGDIFLSKRSDAAFCSAACRQKAYRNRKKEQRIAARKSLDLFQHQRAVSARENFYNSVLPDALPEGDKSALIEWVSWAYELGRNDVLNAVLE